LRCKVGSTHLTARRPRAAHRQHDRVRPTSRNPNEGERPLGKDIVAVPRANALESMQSIVPESTRGVRRQELSDAGIIKNRRSWQPVSNLKHYDPSGQHLGTSCCAVAGRYGWQRRVRLLCQRRAGIRRQPALHDDIERIEVPPRHPRNLYGGRQNRGDQTTSPSCRPMSFRPERA